ncbi:MAG: MMPL family transporter [Egibacteraceae bacterium]
MVGREEQRPEKATSAIPLTPEATDLPRRVQMLSRVAVFQLLSPLSQTDVAELLRPIEVTAGRVVVREGDTGDALYLIEQGTVLVEPEAGEQREPIARLGPGEFFGEMALVNDQPRSATVRAETAARLWAIGATDVQRLLEREPGLARGLRQTAALRASSSEQGKPAEGPRNLASDVAERDELRIGRHPDNDLVLDAPAVSAQHAVVRQFGDGYQLSDLGSAHGTFVNGAPVRVAELKDGDQIRLADQRLVFDVRGLKRGDQRRETPSPEPAGPEPVVPKRDPDEPSRLVRWMARRSGIVIALALAATALLAVPFLALPPDGFASQEPAGEVFTARDFVNERFASPTFLIPFVVEARDGDLLRAEPLAELLANGQALRDDPDIGPKLWSFFDPQADMEVDGLHTIADMVDAELRQTGIGGLAAANDADVRSAASRLIEDAGIAELGLSAQSTRDPDTGDWLVPATSFVVLADDDAVGGPPAGATIGVDDTTKEEFARDVVEVLEGGEAHSRTWGIAIDVNLTSAEQGQAAGPFIGFAILGVLFIVGLTYRSYWPVAIVGGGLATLIVWLNGLSNLLGMEADQILSTIVPIAMISFGVDFAFHAFGRYKEVRAAGTTPRVGLLLGMSGVMGALVLALSSDAAAFLANVSSGIQSIVQFGIAASLGLLSAFLVLGIVAPVVLMRVEERVGPAPRSPRRRLLAVVGSVLASGAAMGSVVLSAFVLPAAGVALLGLYIVAFLVAPCVIAGRAAASPQPVTADGAVTEPATSEPRASDPGRLATTLGGVVAGLARYRVALLPVVLGITVGCAFFAVQVPAEFDVNDFFTPDSDFVVGLDKIDEHFAGSVGEPGIVYLEGDLTDPRALTAVQEFVDAIHAADSPALARDDDGRVQLEDGVLGVVRDVAEAPAAAAAVAASAGVELTDDDGDGLPDTAEQLAAVYTTVLEAGVAADEARLARTPDAVGEVLYQSPDGETQASRVDFPITGTRGQEGVEAARTQLEPLVADLEDRLQAIDPAATAVLTGAPFARQASLDAIARALQISLPIAIVLCLLVAAIFMRSLRYAVVSIVPILLVVAWLYAFMYAFGFTINLVTATIGAISIGIGIDFAIHITMRYREEIAQFSTREAALRATGASTGLALGASALSSMLGFGILALAPMPLFASYGLLTAVMIFLALAASLLVLPSLLALVSRDPVAPG